MRESNLGGSYHLRRTITENSIKNSKVSHLMDRMFGEVKMSPEQQKMMKNEAYLYDEAVKIGEMNDEEIREEELMNDMQTDLTQLFDEGRRESDERSRRIY
jgi:polyhydroxyalkanoate synthesis regulator phasin